MCLIALDYQPGSHHDSRPTILLVANRDEFYRRPSQKASFWQPGNHASSTCGRDDDSDPLENEDFNGIDMIYGGKDLLQGGTWLACSSNGHFGIITNFHCDQDREKQYPRSRGEIVSKFTSVSSLTAREFALSFLQNKLEEYAGFSVLLFDGKTLICCTNRGNTGDDGSDPAPSWFRELQPGLYGLSNHFLDSCWPRTVQAKKVLALATKSLARPYDGKLEESVVNDLLEGFADTRILEDNSPNAPILEGDAVTLQRAVCVRLNGYGTRTTTIICYDDRTGFEFIEKNFETPYEKESYSREVIALQSHFGKKQNTHSQCNPL
ncbi:transport and golgi organization protein [Nitzschia inconspicua]|uniref:Transport and golgi organization protein n=1 Tax=Nitzschia inconspicua TaxID=303405 RepID=A0A9K3KF70_9STRA|nr:transport and golgi organization protein [Nitzschia inconspicua]